MKITIEKVEKLMDKADVSYEVANEALEKAGGDIIEAIISLEKEGKFGPMAGRNAQASYSTKVGSDPAAIGENFGHTMLPQTQVSPNFTYGGNEAGKAGKKKAKKAETGGQAGYYDQAGYYNQGNYGQTGYYGQSGYYQGNQGYRYKDESSEFEDGLKKFGNFIVRLIKGGLVNYFEVWRKGERVLHFPVILFLFCLIHWVFWVALALIIIGLFCGCRYQFSGPYLGKKDINETMDKAADFAEEVKDGKDPDN